LEGNIVADRIFTVVPLKGEFARQNKDRRRACLAVPYCLYLVATRGQDSPVFTPEKK
jgi:hypothetical protein